MASINLNKGVGNAAKRIRESAVARLLFEAGYFKKGTILDYGCGYGEDVKFYRGKGLKADGWDPHLPFGFPEIPRDGYDNVTVINILNVLPTVEQRRRVLVGACSRIRPSGLLIVATRSPSKIAREAQDGRWPEFNDGYLSSVAKGTFQKGFNVDEILALVPPRRHRLKP